MFVQQTTLGIICVHVATCNILEDAPHRAFKRDKPTYVRTWGLKRGRRHILKGAY